MSEDVASHRAVDRPERLRADLVESAQRHRGVDHVVLKDPQKRRYFRVSAAAWQIALRFDGARTPNEIAQELTRQGPGTTTAEDVAGVARGLQRLGLLGSGSAGAAPRRSWFQIRWVLIDPDRFLGGLLALVRPLFSLPAFVGILGLIVWAGILHVVDHRAMVETLRSTLRGAGPIWIVAATTLSLTMHELAHGLTAKRLGAEVHEMGLLLLSLVVPCAYTDVSDAYLLPRKRDRIIVSLAGTVADLLTWALATVLVFHLQPTGALQQVLGAWMLTTGIRSLGFNLNPLLKLDGYYVLVDLLEMPNLHARSRAVLSWRVRRLLRLDARSPHHPDVPSRERTILEIYGWMSALYIAALLSCVGVAISAWAIG